MGKENHHRPGSDPDARLRRAAVDLLQRHYDTYCYIPLVAAISFAGEPDQYVVASILRPGNAPDKRGAISVLSRLLPLLREAFPRAALAVRFDAGFCAPEIIDYIETEGLAYAIAFPSNAVLDRASEIL